MAEIVRAVPVPPGYAAWPRAKDWNDAWWGAWLRGQGWPDPAIVEYLRQRAALSLVVTKGAGKSAERVTLYSPTPKGALFHLDPRPNLLYGGAAGGAKSYTARWDAYLRLLTVPGAKLILLRRKYTELVDNHINDAMREVAVMASHGVQIRYLKDERRVLVERKDGEPSWLRFGHCEHEGDEEDYLSSAYEVFYLDEAATFSQKQAMGIQSRLRSTLSDTPLFRCLSNPGGPQTLWLKHYFMDHAVTAEEHEDYDPLEWGFIGSRLYDNPHYMDPDGTWRKYERRLKGLGRERARQMLDGDWDLIAGQYFSEFRRDVHVREMDVPEGTEYFRCMDWGYNQPGCCLWVACLPDGHLHVRHEWVFRQTLVSDAAAEIVRQTRALGDPYIRHTAADGHMFDATGQGETLAETAARSGLPLLRMDNGRGSRVPGWQRLRAWLQIAPDGKPWLTIDPSCGYLIRTLPALVSDDTNPEDVDTTGEDHAGDALRYGLMSRPSPTRTIAEARTYGPGTAGALFREAVRWASRPKVLGGRHVRTA